MLTDDFTRMVDAERGIVDRRIFSDPAVYELELERIFARSWLFLAHQSQLRNPGDYFSTYMGADPILVCRQRDGSIRASFSLTCSSPRPTIRRACVGGTIRRAWGYRR